MGLKCSTVVSGHNFICLFLIKQFPIEDISSLYRKANFDYLCKGEESDLIKISDNQST